MRESILACALLFLLNALPCYAQTPSNDVPWGINLTYGIGEQYDIPHSKFRVFHIPTVELILPKLPSQGLAFKTSMWLDDITGETARTDIFIHHTLHIGSRFDFKTTAAFIAYHVAFTTPQFPHPSWNYSRQSDRQLFFEFAYQLRKP